MKKPQRIWTADEVTALGIRTDVPTAGAIIAGLCKDEAYRLHSRGEFPVPVVKVGRRYVVPVAPILRLLGIGPPDTDEAGPATGPATVTAITADPRPRSTTEGEPTPSRRAG